MSEIPTPEEITAFSSLPVWDAKGKECTFGSLFENQKTIVVFIRHFFCGICQDYVCQLAQVRQEALDAAGVKLVVIGCGEASMIPNYLELTEYKQEMYADPTRKLHDTLGFTSNLDLTPAGEKPKSYVAGFFGNVTRSVWRILPQITSVGKQGKWSQLGGDLVLGPGTQCSFAWRMRHTQDHVEVKDLMVAAGVEYP